MPENTNKLNNINHAFQPGDVVVHTWIPYEGNPIPIGRYIIYDKVEFLDLDDSSGGYTRYKAHVIYACTESIYHTSWQSIGAPYCIIHYYNDAQPFFRFEATWAPSAEKDTDIWSKVVESGVSWEDRDT